MSNGIKNMNPEKHINNRYNLEDRLLDYAALIVKLTEHLPTTRAGNHIAGQLLRSGTSPLSNHGEAEAAESRQDFIHKLSISLKELRESRRWLRLIHKVMNVPSIPELATALTETDELIRIFSASIKTAEKNEPHK